MAEIKKVDVQKAFHNYFKTIQKTLATGDAGEGSHYPALKSLLEALSNNLTATVLPARIECGNPDFAISKGHVRIGHVEAKDINENLDKVEKSEQLKRYRSSLSNLVLTDFLEFRWFTNGDLRLKSRLGSYTGSSKLKEDKTGVDETSALLSSFLVQKAEPVNNPKELALRMARMTHMLRDITTEALKTELEKGTLHDQLAAFRDSLIPDLTPEQFADMYAQTIAYGLFAARCQAKTDKPFTRLDAAQNLPKTNPFLRKLFQYIAGYDLDVRISWLVDDIAQLLAQADMESVLKDFGKRTGKEDPVVHFYETFLASYDPKLRETRGVYYTPLPVVSYIVRSVDYILKTHFNKPQGLADDKVFILDPAVGTATFLYMVINEIYEHMMSNGQQGMWEGYAAEKLLPRLFGFELLMAPYAVAHLKLGLQLQETGYKFKQDQRLGIYLTNTLEEAIKHSESLFARWITEESNAAAEIKKDKPIMVVLGNPPYSGQSANKGTYAKKLVERYKMVDGKPLGEKNPKWLQDDYVKFISFGQWRIERTGSGVIGFITNHSYLDNPTFRGMRQSLLNTFSDIYIFNLHGNTKKKETSPDGSKDENVFDIQQGVAIGLFIKEPGKPTPGKVHYADLWGMRESKYAVLSTNDVQTSIWKELNPASPHYLFIQQESNLTVEYEQGWKVTDIFPVNSVGIVTARDDLTIHWTREETKNVLEDFSSISVDEAREKYKLGNDSQDWKVGHAQKDLKDSGLDINLITPVLYRPFDIRYTYYTGHSGGFLCRPRPEVMRHMINNNIGFSCPKRVETSGHWQHILCSHSIIDHVVVSLKTIDSLFPLYVYLKPGELQLGESRQPNLNTKFIKEVSDKLKMQFVPDGKGDLKVTFGPEDIFNYAYSVFHSPNYRKRYVEFLRRDFPVLPLTSDKELFRKLAEKGAELVALHLLQAPVLDNPITKYPVTGANLVDKVSYNDSNQRVYINKDQYFEGVPPEVWEFQVGGYQVCHKWLKDRKGRPLSYDDLTHYQKLVVSLKETIRLMAEIDEIIPAWPIN